MSEEQVASAVDRSGYPLQTFVAQLLSESDFGVQDEWCYIDRDTSDLRTIDLRADFRLYHMPRQPRVRPTLTVLAECKQSALPYVFFTSSQRNGLLDHPRIAGLHTTRIVVSSDDDASTWSFPIPTALSLEDETFQHDPPYSTTFSKCVRKGSELELSGAEAYSNLVLPLVKASDHLAVAEAPPKTAWYFDAHLVISLAVVDAPMISSQLGTVETTLELRPWIRVLRHEYLHQEDWTDGSRMCVIDVVHKWFLKTWLDDHLMPFARSFAEGVIRHPTELATGVAFVSGMGADSWTNLEMRLRPKDAVASVRRAAAIGRNLGRLLARRGPRGS